LEIDNRNIHSFIIGEHGDSELPVWSSANISGIDLDDYCSLSRNDLTPKDLYGIFEYVKNSAYEIIRDKGATYYAIAQATKRIITAIVNDEHSILPISAVLDGHYDMRDICLSVPSVIGRNGIEQVLDIPLDSDESKKLHQAAETLRMCLANADFFEMTV